MARTNCLGSQLVWNRRGRSRSICLEWQLIRLEWKSACHAWCWHKKRLKKMRRICTFVELFKFFFISFWLCGGKHVCLFSTNRPIFKQEFLFKKEAKNRTKSTLPHWMWILTSFWVNHIRKTKGYTMIDFSCRWLNRSWTVDIAFLNLHYISALYEKFLGNNLGRPWRTTVFEFHPF